MSETKLPPRAGIEFQSTFVVSTLPADPLQAAKVDRGSVMLALSQSLLSDLRRFAAAGVSRELLPALAACVRHGRSLALSIDLDGSTAALVVDPRLQLFRADVDILSLTPHELGELALVGVNPDLDAGAWTRASTRRIGPLRPLLWHFAMHGSRGDLLPEIDGPVRYRTAHGLSLSGLPVASGLQPLLHRLASSPLSLAELQSDSKHSRATVQRLLNALYLQAGLMILRATPSRLH